MSAQVVRICKCTDMYSDWLGIFLPSPWRRRSSTLRGCGECLDARQVAATIINLKILTPSFALC